MTIGVLALQGDFVEHIRAIRACGVEACEVRLPEDLRDVDGLILPGGESTTIGKLLVSSGLGPAIITRVHAGMPIFGTCAGAIMLARDITGYPQQYRLGLIDIEIDRNAYGRQIDSFVTDLKFQGKSMPATFIRAPKIMRCGPGVDVLISHQGDAVLVHEKNVLAGTFHPELAGKNPVHEYFITMCHKKS